MDQSFTRDARLGPISPHMVVVLSVVASLDIDGTMYWTSGVRNDEGSLHDPSEAGGWKTSALDGDALSEAKNADVTHALRNRLPGSFDVLHEDAGGENDHVHIEHDPN